MTKDVIADAAIAYIDARRERKWAKTARIEAFADNQCERPVPVGSQLPHPFPASPTPCHRILAFDAWCGACCRAQLAHDAYRRAASRQGRALRTLTSIVNAAHEGTP